MIQYKKILVPIDFSDYSKQAMKYASELAGIFNSEIILIYVVEPIIYPPDLSIGQIALPTLTYQIDENAKEELDRVAGEIIPKEIKFTSIVKLGKPFIEIIGVAESENIDLIVISTHGHTGVEHMLFGSTADKVVRKAHCPVLTLRANGNNSDEK
ncbi:MAG: universal stress protein [Ignavibacteriaceae bacterium]|nr:MAG: universal stress protein [Ignavibacteriaceae bacterium]